MRIVKRTAIALGLICFLFSTLILMFWQRRHSSKPLGKAPAIEFPSGLSQPTKIQLLEDDFKIVGEVGALPPAVQETFRETGGSRLVLANRGANFNPGDVISDATVPQERLIFAGVSKDKCFVHYERGGRGHSYIVEVFELGPGAEARPLWFGYCRQPANDMEKLRSE